MNDLFFLKNKQRQQYKEIRKKISQRNNYIFKPHIIDKFFDNNKFKNINIVSSFIPIKNEIPTFELNAYILSKNKILSLPIVENKNNILIFREYKNKESLIKGKYNIQEPSSRNNIVIPDLLFVPSLAFDINGYRLGYGGGYYDRTFSYFKKIKHKFISIGFGYEDQKADKIIRNNFDYKLDYFFTEKQLYSFL